MLRRSDNPFIELSGKKVTASILFAQNKDRTLSFPRYLQAGFRPLELGLIMNGYYDNPRFRESILDYPGFGEYAGALLVDGKELIEEPELIFNPGTRLWELRGGKSRTVELPDNGLINYFDPETGLPAKAGRHVSEEHEFLPPYFKREDRDMSNLQGVHTVIRFHGQYQPLVIDATHELNENVPHIGARMII